MAPSTRALAPALVAAALLLVSCGDDGPTGPAPGPVAGALRVDLSTPAPSEGGLVLTLSGPSLPAPASIQALTPGARVFARSTSSGLKVAIFGELRDGALLRFPVSDVDAAGRYAAVLVEVAAPDFTLRSDLAAYALSIARGD